MTPAATQKTIPALQDQTIVLASNGYADGNAEAIAQYLKDREVKKLVVLKHPLVKEQASHHKVEVWARGKKTAEKTLQLPFVPPYTYPLDMFVPLLPQGGIDVWMGFGNLNAFRGLMKRRIGSVKKVIYNSIDFTPDRFGKDSKLTLIYDWIDRYCCLRSDEIWTLSWEAHKGRLARLSANPKTPAKCVPMGAWLSRTPRVSPENFTKRQLVFMGHLLEKQGLQGVLHAIAKLPPEFSDVSLVVIGSGEYRSELERLTASLGLASRVKFLGFVQSHQDIEQILAESTAGLATYAPELASFTKYADAGKLKAYMAAGLPIVMTDVPPSAQELKKMAGAEVVDYQTDAIARGLMNVMQDRDDWNRRTADALTYIRQFDWDHILGNAFH